MDTNQKLKVAILGGGLGSTTAAFYLTSTPELREKYDVHIYQMGWRLGGKGASGRNRKIANRIEEHGIHLLMGFYQNAFTMLKAVYDEWNKNEPPDSLRSFANAFRPQYFFTLEDRFEKDGKTTWNTWNIELPKLPGQPWDIENPATTIEEVGEAILKFICSHLQNLSRLKATFMSESLPKPSLFDKFLLKLEEGIAEFRSDIGEHIFQEANKLLKQLNKNIDHDAAIINEITEIFSWVTKVFSDFVESIPIDIYHIWSMLDIGVAALKGYLTDVFPYGTKGFDRINNLDFRTWLKRHGASPGNVDGSVMIRGFYDMIFSYIDGETADPAAAQCAAGTMFLVIFRLGFTYKNAPMWHMHAGMGDTIFSPLYELLEQRGVNFHFFHKVTNLGLSQDKSSIQTISMERQAETINGPYRPLFLCEGLPCWPSEPDWSQLKYGEKYQKSEINFESYWSQHQGTPITLEKGIDFDLVVLGISLGALPYICQELIQARPEWRNMCYQIKTVVTQACQIWTYPDAKELGWEYPPTVLTGYGEPFDTWADMSDLLPRESWPSNQQPKNIAYLCGVMSINTPPFSDDNFPKQAYEQVKKNANQWLNDYASHLWPHSVADQQFNKELLVDLSASPSPENRFGNQFFRANIDPSERYVLSTPDTIRFRLRANESGFYNLYLAGDWLKTSLSAGCVEAAVEGGMQASQAICGLPKKIYNE